MNILESQIGYHPRDVKQVFLRCLPRLCTSDPDGTPFDVIDASRAVRYSGAVRRWGEKWGSMWWVLDFTPVRAPGDYRVRFGDLLSSEFTIGETVFADEKLAAIALDQLDQRIDEGETDTKVSLKGHYKVPGARVYRDCGSHYAEIEAVGTVVHGLADLQEWLGDRFSDADRARMIGHIALGAQYFVDAQVRSDDPETNGRFHHSILVNSMHPWASDVFSYHDMAYAMTVLARAAAAVEPVRPDQARTFREAAIRAWNCATLRPYHLPDEWQLPPGCPAEGIPFWTPEGFVHTIARRFYDIRDPEWKMPTTLRTRDRLPFIWGSALLYEATGEAKYLDAAIEFAHAVAERQFTDWEHPIEGTFGAFREFEGDDRAFVMEFSQGGHWWMGNFETTDLSGFAALARLVPDHRNAAEWHNVIRTYGEHYLKRAALLTPFRLHPNACYRDPVHGGIKFFQNNICGNNGMFGLGARSLMVIGAFLNDASYQALANANIEFIAGLNPGIPNAHEETSWQAQSFIKGVGRRWFGAQHELGTVPDGAICNGFCAAEQFWIYSDYLKWISDVPDGPRGLVDPKGKFHFNEDWIYHSHAYVSGVARLEGPFVLRVRARAAGAPVAAAVVVTLREVAAPHVETVHTFTADSTGALSVKTLPTQTAGTIAARWDGAEAVREIQPLASTAFEWDVDFEECADLAVGGPPAISPGGTGSATITVANRGVREATFAVRLSAAGVLLDRDRVSVTLRSGESRSVVVGMRAGDRVMPYLVRARIGGRTPTTAVCGGLVGHATG